MIADNASPLFRLAPYVVFGTMVAAAAIIPSMGTRPAAHAWPPMRIALVGLLATARVFLSLAAMDIGTAFGTLGARREMMIGFLAEPALLMVIFVAVADLASTTSLPLIADSLGDQRVRAVSEPRLHRASRSRWCCWPRTPASRSTIRRRTSN